MVDGCRFALLCSKPLTFTSWILQEEISNVDVVTKYKAAAKIVNSKSRIFYFFPFDCPQFTFSSLLADAMAAVIEACKPGAKVADISIMGDKLMVE